MKILILTNILTPYRINFYEKLNNELKNRGDELKIFVLADSEPNRTWKYNDFKKQYTKLLKSININLKGDIFINFAKNIKVELDKYMPDKIIIGGSYLNPNIFSIINYSKKNKDCDIYFWSESHLNEEKNYSVFKKFIRERIRKIVLRNFKKFCVPGKLAEDFVLNYSSNSEVIYLPNLIDEEYYKIANERNVYEKMKIKNKYNIEKGKFIFLLPARLAPVKGILEFINIYKLSNHKNSTILIAGDGELKNKIKEESIKYDLDIKLLGNRTQEEMLDLYTISDCLLLPSLSDPNPLSCIEALWSGLPLLISNKVGNNPEVVIQGKNGFVFNYNRVNETIDMINKLIESNDSWKEQANILSKNIANERFNSKICIEKFIRELKNEVNS